MCLGTWWMFFPWNSPTRCPSPPVFQWHFLQAMPTHWVKTSWCTPALWLRGRPPGQGSKGGWFNMCLALPQSRVAWIHPPWPRLPTTPLASVLLSWWSPSTLMDLSTRWKIAREQILVSTIYLNFSHQSITILSNWRSLFVCVLSRLSLNSLCLQWAVTFAERSAFSNVMTVSHNFRYCGHRFHLNDQACHTVLPLLLTSSHHNALLTPPSAPGSLEGEQPPSFPLPRGLPR